MPADPIVLGIIPARGGSKGIPRKNIRPICGKPMIVYTIEAANRSKRLSRVVVSTDDDCIAQVSQQAGAQVIRRPAEYAKDTAPIEFALRHAVQEVEKQGRKVDIVVWMQANLPLRKDGVIDESVRIMIEEGADSVVTVVQFRKPIQWSFRMEGNRLIPFEGINQYIVRRQDCVPAYYQDGAVITMRRDNLMGPDAPKGQWPAYYGRDRRAIVQEAQYGIEVDEPADLWLVDFMMRRELNQL